MKELTEDIRENLEELLNFEKDKIYTDNIYEEYLSSLSKKGYEVRDYKDKYFKILRKRNGLE